MSDQLATSYGQMQALPPELRRRHILPEMRRIPLHRFAQHIGDTVRRACLGEMPWPLTFLGRPGTGKTTVSLAMLDGCGGLRWTFEEWVAVKPPPYNDWKTGGASQASCPTCDRRYQTAGYRGFCVLDDIAQRDLGSTWGTHGATLQRCLDIRLNCPTLLISNRENLDEWEQLYGAAVKSRVEGGTMLEFADEHRKEQGVIVSAQKQGALDFTGSDRRIGRKDANA